MPGHAHLDRIPIRIRRLQKLAGREPHELLQMLRLPRFVRKGRVIGLEQRFTSPLQFRMITSPDAAADDIIDDPESEDFEAPIRYAVTCYGSDPDVESLVKRIRQNEIIVPDFQRTFVWKIREASRFIESLLLGLPVPGIFMAKERHTNKMLLIDGQQRLKTLQFFYAGYFNPKDGESKRKVFRLSEVHESFSGKTYETLEDADRR